MPETPAPLDKPPPATPQEEAAPPPPSPEATPPIAPPPVVEQEPTPPPAPETPAPSDLQEAVAPPPSHEVPAPPAAPPPVVASQDPASEPKPAPKPSMSVESQMQPLPPPPDTPPPEVATLPPAAQTSIEGRSEQPPPPSPPPPPDQVRRQPQPHPKLQARLEPAERQKPRKLAEARSSPSANKSSLSKPGSAEARRVGEANGRAADAGMSRASYAALVVAQIQAHRFYPEAARTRSEQGAVGVSFTIGASGRVSTAAITRSSGFAELDGAASQIVRSISPPRPRQAVHFRLTQQFASTSNEC